MSCIKIFLLSISFAFVALSGFAQTEDCELTLARAQEEFNAGHFYVIPTVLNTCLTQFTREQSQRAYLLLTQTYLLLDDPIGARESYLNVLRANPEFLPDTALHPIDVIYLSKKFTATSIFSWFAKAGANISMPRIIHDLTPFAEMSVKENYLLKIGYQAAVGGDLNFSEKINLRGELGYTLASYSHETTQYFNRDRKIMDERLSWLSFPLTVVYNDHLGKYRPYGYLGYGVRYLLASRSEVTLINNKPVATSETGEREDTSQPSPTLRTEFKRNRFNQSIVMGVGTKLKVGLDFVFFDLRYNMGLRNVTSPQNLYGDYTQDDISASFIASAEPSMRFGQVDDFFRLDNLFISVGFLRPLYKPRELKRARTRSVMKQLNQ